MISYRIRRTPYSENLIGNTSVTVVNEQSVYFQHASVFFTFLEKINTLLLEWHLPENFKFS